MAGSAYTSHNFAFLAKHDTVLVHHTALAERYVFDDPNSALIKLRQFGELLAQHAAACVGIAVEERETQMICPTKSYCPVYYVGRDIIKGLIRVLKQRCPNYNSNFKLSGQKTRL
jgi:hypothetical protein